MQEVIEDLAMCDAGFHGIPAVLEGEAAALKSSVIGSRRAFIRAAGLDPVVAVFCQTLLIHTPGAAALLRPFRCMSTLRLSLLSSPGACA